VLLFRVLQKQGTIADDIDEAWDPAAGAMDGRHGIRCELKEAPFVLRHAPAVQNTGTRLALGQRAKVLTQGDTLHQGLPPPGLQPVAALRLAEQDDLEQPLAVRLQVPQQADLLQGLVPQVLGLVEDQGDKAVGDAKVHAGLAKAGIEPVIQNRSLWKEDSERMLPGHDGRSNIVYDEAGTVHCYDKTSERPVRQRMAFIGHEPSRGTLKYRCPAMHEG